MHLLGQLLEGRAEDDVLRVSRNGTLVLSPEEWPVVEVLKVVGLAEEYARSHVAGYGREVGTVVAIEHLLGASGSYRGYERVVVVGMTTEYPVGKLTEEEFPLLDNDDVLVKDDIFRLLRESGVGVPAYYEEIPFEVDGKTGTYCRSRSGCYFCFFQQRIEWVWLLEQHPDLYEKAMTFEKDGYTWIQGETLTDLAMPERVRQIKLDIINRQEKARQQQQGTTLVDILGDDLMCTNCFI